MMVIKLMVSLKHSVQWVSWLVPSAVFNNNNVCSGVCNAVITDVIMFLCISCYTNLASIDPSYTRVDKREEECCTSSNSIKPEPSHYYHDKPLHFLYRVSMPGCNNLTKLQNFLKSLTTTGSLPQMQTVSMSSYPARNTERYFDNRFGICMIKYLCICLV